MHHRLGSTAIVLAALLAVPGVASATVFDVTVFADVSGTDTRAACGPGEVFPACPLEVLPYAQAIARYLGPMDLAEGDNPFTSGGYYSVGYVTGTITNDNGVLTGRDLTYAYASCSGPCPGDHIVATARSFRVTGGVPEPATWITLLLGMGAVGWAERRCRRASAPDAPASASAETMRSVSSPA